MIAMLSVLLLCRAAAAQEAAQPAPLGVVVETALRNSPSVRQADENKLEAEAALLEARLGALPTLSARAAVTRGDDPVYAFGSLLEQRRFGPQNFAIGSLNNPGYLTDVRSSLELGLPIFTGFALRDARELGRIQAESAAAGAIASSQATRFRVAEAYLRGLAARALLENARRRLASASAELDQARSLRARGLVLGADFYAADALRGSLEASRIGADEELRTAQSTLAILTGQPLHPVDPVGSLDDTAYSSAPLAAFVDDALRGRQDLRQSEAAESAAVIAERRERSSLLPSVDAFGSLESNTSDFGSNPVNRMAGIRAQLSFGDATYFGRVARAAAARRSARAGAESARQNAALEVLESYNGYTAAAASLPVLRDSVDRAETALDLLLPLYREGRRSVLDVLRAETGLHEARAGYLGGLLRTHLSWARLQLVSGRLDDRAVGDIERRLRSGR